MLPLEEKRFSLRESVSLGASVLLATKMSWGDSKFPAKCCSLPLLTPTMMKLLLLASLVTLLSVTSAFVTPSSSSYTSSIISSRSVTPPVAAAVKVPTSLFVSPTNSNDTHNLPTLAAATTASVMTFLTPLAASAEEAGDYEYGAVAAPGGIGLAVGLGVLAVSFPVLLNGGDFVMRGSRSEILNSLMIHTHH
jgi:hypothetical protein